MFLKRIVLENVRSIKELEMTFDPADIKADSTPRKWTLLLGENGCGKSTLLRSVALVLAGGDALPGLLVDPSYWIRQGTKRARIIAELVTKDGEERRVELQLDRADQIADVFKKNEGSLSKLDRALKHSPRNYFLSGYGASRRLPGKLKESFHERESFGQVRAQNVATLFQNDAALRSLESWAMDLHYQKGSRGLHVIRDTFKGLLPEVEFKRIDRKRRKVLFDTPDGILPLEQLSDGYQNVAAWCGDLLYRITETFQDYTKPLHARGLLLIDELDLHLHPVWQRRLIDFLSDKLPSFQIIATTHSPLTAQQVGEGELYALQRRDKQSPAELFQYRGSPRRLRVEQLLVSPIFGVETAASKKVESLHGQYRRLEAKPKQTAGEKRELASLRATLAELPLQRTATKEERRRTALLQSIQKELGGETVAAAPSVPEQIRSKLVKV